MPVLPVDKDLLIAALEEQVRDKRENRMRAFQPYPRQYEFFELGFTKRERGLLAGTQTGKSEGGAFEATCHATGLYPDWWPGKRFNRPTHGWIAGITGEQVRNVAQTKLYGTPGSDDDWGTGLIPKSLLLGKTLGHGVSNFYDTVRIRHATGGTSTIGQKAYSQGRHTFQGPTLDWAWADEECAEDIYSEIIARLRGDGIIWTTFTPLLGYTRLVRRLLQPQTEDEKRDRGITRMGLRHAEHFSADEKRARLAAYPAHERAARENGDPMLGSGAVFEDVTEDDIKINIQLSDAPEWFAKLWGLDFGGGGDASHPFAAVLVAWDREADVIYVLDAFRMKTGTVMNHASRIKRIAPKVKVAWPHDGHQIERGSGSDLANLYRAEGLDMLMTHATHQTGNFSTEAGIQEILNRMRAGGFKVAAHLHEWWEEFRSYHRTDDGTGKIVKIDDDLMSATRIAVMARRYAVGVGFGGTPDRASREAALNDPATIAKRTNFDVFEPWGAES